MLTGKKLGEAIAAAIKAKKISQKALAEEFGVKPPSIQDWINRGTIDKSKLPKMWAFFADVVGPEHWGLAAFPMPIDTPINGDESGFAAESIWPFRNLDESKIRQLKPDALQLLEGAFLLAATQLKYDVRVPEEGANSAGSKGNKKAA